MAATSSPAVLNGLGSSFLGGKRTQTLLSSNGVVGARTTVASSFSQKKFFVAAAAAAKPKKSWIPGVKAGGNFVDPEWLDGS